MSDVGPLFLGLCICFPLLSRIWWLMMEWYVIEHISFRFYYLPRLETLPVKLYLQNTRETAHAIRKLPLAKAKRYLEDVLAHKQAIPFRRFCGGVGRTAQAKNRHSNGQGRWPVKSAKFILDLLKNAESNAEVCSESLFALLNDHFMATIFKPLIDNCFLSGERPGCRCSLHFSYPG